MGNNQLFVKHEKVLKNLIKTIRVYKYDIEIKLRIEKCAMLIMKSRKREIMKGRELQNYEKN